MMTDTPVTITIPEYFTISPIVYPDGLYKVDWTVDHIAREQLGAGEGVLSGFRIPSLEDYFRTFNTLKANEGNQSSRRAIRIFSRDFTYNERRQNYQAVVSDEIVNRVEENGITRTIIRAPGSPEERKSTFFFDRKFEKENEYDEEYDETRREYFEALKKEQTFALFSTRDEREVIRAFEFLNRDTYYGLLDILTVKTAYGDLCDNRGRFTFGTCRNWAGIWDFRIFTTSTNDYTWPIKGIRKEKLEEKP